MNLSNRLVLLRWHRENARKRGSHRIEHVLADAYERYQGWYCPNCETTVTRSEIGLVYYTESRVQPHHRRADGTHCPEVLVKGELIAS